MRKIDTRRFVRATRSTSREINRQILLNLVREHQPISRADLARRMEMGRGMVTAMVDELLAEGAIYEGDTIDAPRGRRPMMLHVRTRDRFVVAIDVRFSRTYLMLSDFGGTPVAIESFDTVVEPTDLVGALALRIQSLLEAHNAVGRCEGIGLVVPGMIDHQTGRVLNSPQLGWHDVDIRDALSDATGLSVHIENAPIACALAQMWLGHREGESSGNFVYVTVSDGVGVGIVVNGEVIRGHGNTAGEFGHIPLSFDGPQCLCGSQGCLEAYTSNLATVSRYLGEALSPTSTRELLQRSKVTIADVIERANAHDPRAEWALNESARYLGIGLSMVIKALNPSLIFVGGEITAAWDRLAPMVRQQIVERALTETAANTPIVPEPAGTFPRLRGATALVAAPVFAAPKVA